MKEFFNNILTTLSIFLAKFTNRAAYAAAESSLAEPNVSYCTQENEVHYKPIGPIDYSSQYLGFIADGDITYKFSNAGISYSLDNGDTWTSLAANTATPTIHAGENILWKGTITPSSSDGIGKFSSTGDNTFAVQGNPMSLLYGDGFKNRLDLTGKDFAFYNLFQSCTKLISAENLSLPVTTLASDCYRNMFNGCRNLTSAPELPATTLASGCYQYMFYGCTGLTAAPELPATTLAENCYTSMFGGCRNLTSAPELPATTLASNCYRNMFYYCSSLTSAPELPATTLADYCYQYMFYDCTSLTAAPELPATTLADYCYNGMFYGCSILTTAPVLPATTLAEGCYFCMFNGCRNLTEAPELPATTLASGCYQGMFYYCSSLTAAPELPATTLANYCYEYMFKGCSSLTTAPELPVTTLVAYCYNGMFQGCSVLNYIKCLATTDISTTNCSTWVTGVASSGTFVKDASATWTAGTSGIPSGWTVENA